MKLQYAVLGLVAVLIFAAWILLTRNPSQDVLQVELKPEAFDAQNATIAIEGDVTRLHNGVSEKEIPNSSAKIVTRYFGNEAVSDLNNDGKDDVAFLVTRETGGSGLYYYAVVALSTSNGYRTTNAVFIGDRIAPQSTYIPADSQEIQVNYAERKPGEPLTAQPKQGATLVLKVNAQGVLEGVLR